MQLVLALAVAAVHLVVRAAGPEDDVNRTEFILQMLVVLGQIEREDVLDLNDLFNALDITGDGTLNRDDIEQSRKMDAKDMVFDKAEDFMKGLDMGTLVRSMRQEFEANDGSGGSNCLVPGGSNCFKFAFIGPCADSMTLIRLDYVAPDPSCTTGPAASMSSARTLAGPSRIRASASQFSSANTGAAVRGAVAAGS